MSKARIKLTIVRPDGRRSDMAISGEHVTPLMLEVAEELLYTTSTNERAPKKSTRK